MADRNIGVVIRFGFNDYEILLTNLTDEDDQKLWEILTPYADGNECCSYRGDKTMTLEDCNIGWLERDWQPKYRSTENPKDIVTLNTIFERYMDNNGTHKGFEEYVDSGFMNDNEKEYEEIK